MDDKPLGRAGSTATFLAAGCDVGEGGRFCAAPVDTCLLLVVLLLLVWFELSCGKDMQMTPNRPICYALHGSGFHLPIQENAFYYLI